MRRQFSGLSMERQLTYAREYKERFGARIILGSGADPVQVDGVPALSVLAPEDAEALRELDDRCHAEWRER